MFSQMVGVGEQTGELPSYLQTLALYYEEALDRAISRLLGLVEPLIILVVGALVGFIAVSVISPLYSLVAQMK
jgi:type IV pilus assembly protein PilC